MKTIRHFLLPVRRAIAMALLPALSLVAVSCGVTGPDEQPWESVASFSWPTTAGFTMKYRTENRESDTYEYKYDTITVEPADQSLADALYNGEQMYVLNNPQEGFAYRVLFLPVRTGDTLIVRHEKFGGELALVAPLEKGSKWISSSDSAWEAEIIERFAFRKVEGVTYKNVIAVRYEYVKDQAPFDGKTQWIRFYAEGVGEILTIKNVIPVSTGSGEPIPVTEQLKVLIETSPAPAS